MKSQNQEITILHDEFGKELFHIQNAKYNLCQVEKNRWEFVVYIDTDYSIKRSKELEEIVHAEPTIEATAILKVKNMVESGELQSLIEINLNKYS